MTTIPAPQAVDLDSVRAAWRKRLRKAYIAQPPAWWLLQLGLDDMSAAFQQLPPFYDHLSVPDAVKVFVGLAGIRDSLTPVMRRYLAIATNLEATSRWDNVPPSDRTEAGDLCPICADEYDPDHTVVRAACAHILHRDCLEDWLDKGHTTCPFCRRDFTILCMMYMWAGTENIPGTIEMWKNKDQIMSATYNATL